VAPFQVLGPLVAKESLGGAKAWGLIQTAFAIGALLGGGLALRWKPARPMVACSALILLELPAVALLALRAPALSIAAAQLIGRISMGFFTAVWATTLQRDIPPESLSRVSAYDWLGSFAFLPLGYVLAGPASEAIGVSTTIWISASWIVASTAAVLLVPGVRRLKRSEPADRPVAEPAGAESVV